MLTVLEPSRRAAIALLSGTIALGMSCGPPPPARVVLVTVESLPSDLAALPLLRARAEKGQRFESFYAASAEVVPALRSLLTGLHPWEGPRALRTVAEELAARGFSTGFAGSERLLRRHERLGRGFPPVAATSNGPERITELATAILDRPTGPSPADSAGRFLWVHYPDSTSGPLASRAPDLDRAIERLLARLEEDRDVLDLGILVAGVGATPGPGPEPPVTPTKALRRQLLAPLLLLSPIAEPRARRDVAGSVDVARTLLSLAGVEYPGDPFRGARDLSDWAPDPALDPQATAALRVGALGTWRRAPGSVPLFYAVDRAGRLYAGTGDVLQVSPSDATLESLDQARRLFEALESRGSTGTNPPDPSGGD